MLPIEANEITAEKIKALAVEEGKLAEAVQRKILGTTAVEAEKEETEANSETGVTPSATKAALVTVALKAAEAVKTVWAVENNTVSAVKFSQTTAVGSVYPLGTFLVQPNTKIKLKKTEGKATFIFSIQLMN